MYCSTAKIVVLEGRSVKTWLCVSQTAYSHLGIAIGHVLHHTARGKLAACGVNVAARAIAGGVNGDVDDGLDAFGLLLAELEKAHLPHWHQRGQHLQLGRGG